MPNKVYSEFSVAKTNYRVLVITLLLSLPACTTPTLKKNTTVEPNSASMLHACSPPTKYAQKALHWNHQSRGEELERLAQSLNSSESYCSVLELAIFLSTPSKSFQDDLKAYLLLQKLDKDNRLTESEHGYVSRLLPHVEQRLNLRKQIKFLQNNIHD